MCAVDFQNVQVCDPGDIKAQRQTNKVRVIDALKDGDDWIGNGKLLKTQTLAEDQPAAQCLRFGG